MQIETCQVGGRLRLDDSTRIVIHRRQGQRVCLGVTAPEGMELMLGGALVRPISGAVGVWTYLFSLQALRRFSLGRYEVRIWLPGELVPLAADCEDWLHIGVMSHSPVASPPPFSFRAPQPAPVRPASPPSQAEHDGGRLLSRGCE
ncbi:MAG: hypothetical protein ACOY82_04770 [Pseudomonadota bacterium]